MVHTSLKGNLVAHFKKSAEQNPKKCAVISTKKDFKSKTFEDLFIEVKKTAYYFKNKGIKKGDNSSYGQAWDRSNKLLFWTITPGCNSYYHRSCMGIKSLLECIKISKPVGIVGIPIVVNFSYLFRDTFRTVKLRIPVRTTSPFLDTDHAHDFKNFEHVSSLESDVTAIVFTSGSTGRPKE